MLHDGIGDGMSTDGVEGERIDCTGGGSRSETGISETSPVLPSINDDRVGGGDGDSITTPLRRSEPVRNGDKAERRALRVQRMSGYVMNAVEMTEASVEFREVASA